MNLPTIICNFLLSSFLVSSSSAQLLEPTVKPASKDGFMLVHLEKGLCYVWNAQDTHFTYDLVGEKVKLVENTSFIEVDKQVFQLYVLKRNELNSKGVNDLEKLKFHSKWEADWLAKQLDVDLELKGDKITLKNGRVGYLWHFVLPNELGKSAKVSDMKTGAKADPKKAIDIGYSQCYLSIIDHQNLILMNVRALNKAHHDELQVWLKQQMEKVKFKKEYVNVHEVSAAVLKRIKRDK